MIKINYYQSQYYKFLPQPDFKQVNLITFIILIEIDLLLTK